jgi:hypothetical protein
MHAIGVGGEQELLSKNDYWKLIGWIKIVYDS